MRFPLPLPLLLVLPLAGCTSDGDGSSGFSGALDAGADLDVVPAERVKITPTLDGVVPEWIQLSGPAVDLELDLSGGVSFVAPEFPSIVDLRLRGRAGGEVVVTDDVRVTVRGSRRLVDFELAARVDLGAGPLPGPLLGPLPGPLRALTSDPTTRETFVVRGDEVLGFDLADPTSPASIGTLPPPGSGFQSGGVRDVAVGGGLVAVVHDGTPTSAPGRLLLHSAATLAELGAIEIPPRPAEVVVAPSFGGIRFAIACAADPRPDGAGGLGDGRGAVLLVTVPPSGPGSLDPMNDVVAIDFAAFDGQAEALRNAGVRLPRPEVSVSRDLEPRSIAVDGSGSTATVALPANGAVARVDFSTGEVLSVRGLPLADFGGEGFPGAAAMRERLAWRAGRPEVEITDGAGTTRTLPRYDLAAFHVVEATPSTFVVDAVTGRGIARGVGSSSFGPIAQYSEPDRPHGLTRIVVDRTTGDWSVTSEVEFAQQDGTPITARPNFADDGVGSAPADEFPRALDGTTLPADPFGAFFTGVTRVGDEIWCSDARRPSIYRFDRTGLLVERVVPEGANGFGTIVGADTLPATYARRYRDQQARYFGGFHGIAGTSAGEVAVLCGAPLDNPTSAFGLNSLESRIVRLLLIDPATGQPAHEYAVVLDARGRRFLDLAWVDGALHAVEDGSCGGGRALVRFDLAGATDLLALGPDRPAVDAGLETTEPGELGTAFAVPIVPVRKTVLADLSAAGLTGVYGLSIASTGSGSQLAFATSDLHRVELTGGASGPGGVCSFFIDANPTASLGLVDIAPRSFDPSDLDGGFDPRSYPVAAFRQVTSLVVPRTLGSPPTVYAVDGGLVRSVGGLFEEAADARDRTLDTSVFPDPNALLADDAIGPLRVSALDGDVDGDGLDEVIRAFGGRSLLTLDEDLEVLHDSGHGLTRALFQRRPDLEARLEAAAPLAGIAPTSAVLFSFDSMLAVGCEGAGTVAVFDPRSREAPVLLDLLELARGARPVDVEGFEWNVAPGDRRYVVLALDAENGTLDVFGYQLAF